MAGDAVAIGTFDGVHRGHQAVLGAARDAARRHEGQAVAYTFDIPPRTLAGDEPARLITPPPLKRALLRPWVDKIVEASFPELRDRSPESFVHGVLVGELSARSVAVGASFRFGRARSGDVATFAALAADAGLDLIVVPPVISEGSPISSTRVRQLLVAGDIAAAASLLGRPPALRGDVIRGDALGRTLGFPTANLRLDPRVLLPRDGVYLARAYVDGSSSLSLVYVGRRPTLAGAELRCEAHLLEPPSAELVGRTLEVHLYELLRGDRAFASLDELTAQMALDLREARARGRQHPTATDPHPFGG